MNNKELVKALERLRKEYSEIMFETDRDFLQNESGKVFSNSEELTEWVDGLDLSGGYDNAIYTIGLINGLEAVLRLLKD